MKKLVLFGLLLILLTSFVSATIDVQDSFNRSNRGLNGDTADNGNNWVASGATAPSIVSSEAVLVDTGVNPTASLAFVLNDSDQNLTWTMKSTDVTASGVFMQLYNGATPEMQVSIHNSNVRAFDGPPTNAWIDLVAASNNVFYDIEIVNVNYTSHIYDVIVDGTLYNNGGVHFDFQTGSSSSIDKLTLLVASSITGTYDEIYIETPTPPPPDENESSERTFVFNKSGSVIVSGPAFTTIINSTFNTSISADIYFGYRFSLDSTTNSKIECRINNDNDFMQSSINRSVSTDVGTMYVVTNTTNISSGEHWNALQCRRLGAGNIDISNILGIGHYLIDINNDTISNTHLHLENISVNSSSFVEVGSVNLTASNINFSDHIRSFIFNWAEEIIYGSDNEVQTLIQVNGTNCSFYPRFGTTSISGNIGGDCVLNTISAGENINFTILLKGDVNLNHFHGVVKEFVLDPGELISEDLTGINITSSTLSNILNITMNNTDHANSSFFLKAGIPSMSNTIDTNAFYQFRVTGAENFNGTLFEQRAKVNNTVLIVQEIFEGLGVGDYQFELWASCDNSNCTLTGGDLVGYITDIGDVIPVGFELRAFDFFDNSTISNFSVIVEDGLTFSTTTGLIDVTHDEELANMTITSDFNGGYFNLTVLNHNISNGALNVSLNQTIINWNCIEKVSGNDLSCTSPNETTFFNYNVIGNPNNQSLNVTNYFEIQEIFNVSALQNETLNLSFYSTNLTINSTGNVGDPATCTYNVTGLTYPSYFESVSGTPSAFIGLINATYSILADCDGYAYTTENLTINLTQQTFNFSLLTTNSFNITFRDDVSNDLLTGVNITVEFIGATGFTNITNTGSLYVDLIVPSEYTIVFDADGYRQNQYIITLDDRDSVNLTLYMDLDNTTNLVLINVKDTFGNVIQGGDVTIQRYGNDAWFTEQIRRTDFQGRTEGYFVLSTVFYNFLVEYQGTTFFGTINSNADKKQIYAEDVSNGITIIINTVVDETINNYQSLYGVTVTPISFVNTSNTSAYFRFAWDDSDNVPRNGTLNVYRDGVINCTNTASTEAGTLFCFFNETSNAMWTAIGYIDGEAVDSHSIRFGPSQDLFKDWGALGYALAFFLVIISYFMFLENPSISIYAGTGAFASMIIFGVIFKDFNLAGISLLIVLSAFVAGINSKQGVNT